LNQKWKKRSKRENMDYDAEKDECICADGKRLKPIYLTTKKEQAFPSLSPWDDTFNAALSIFIQRKVIVKRFYDFAITPF